MSRLIRSRDCADLMQVDNKVYRLFDAQSELHSRVDQPTAPWRNLAAMRRVCYARPTMSLRYYGSRPGCEHGCPASTARRPLATEFRRRGHVAG